MCQRADFPILQLGVPTCQRRANFSTFSAKKRANFSTIVQKNFQSVNFSIILNICKFQEYLGHSRKFISRNKEFKFRHLQNFKEMQNYFFRRRGPQIFK